MVFTIALIPSTFSFLCLMSSLDVNVRSVSLRRGHYPDGTGQWKSCYPSLKVLRADACIPQTLQRCLSYRDTTSIKSAPLPGSPTFSDRLRWDHETSQPCWPNSEQLWRVILAPELFWGVGWGCHIAQVNLSPCPVLLPSSLSSRCSSQENSSIITVYWTVLQSQRPGEPSLQCLSRGRGEGRNEVSRITHSHELHVFSFQNSQKPHCCHYF